MLVLSRKKDESIVLDGQIEIQVLKIKGNTVRLGIKAPAHIKVLRGELSPFDVEVEIDKDELTSSELSKEETKKEETKKGETKKGEGVNRIFGAPLMDRIPKETVLPNPFANTTRRGVTPCSATS